MSPDDDSTEGADDWEDEDSDECECFCCNLPECVIVDVSECDCDDSCEFTAHRERVQRIMNSAQLLLLDTKVKH